MPDLPPAEAIPGMMPGAPPMPAAPSSAAAVQPVPANVVSATVVVGVAADQPAGTDSPPTEDASPIPAAIAPPIGAWAPASVVPKPNPAPSGVASPMLNPNAEPAMKCASSGRVAVIIAEFHASVTPTL